MAGRRPHQNSGSPAACRRGKEPGAAQEGVAAHGVEFQIVAVEFGRAGDAQPVAEAGEDDLVTVVGEAHRGGGAVRGERQGGRITLAG